MNSYYSNLIEGHRTTPKDIDAALNRALSANRSQRVLQIQHLAHMDVQAEMEKRLSSMHAEEICSPEFFCWLHQRFYERLPEELQTVKDEKGKTHQVQPGKLRDAEVSAGRHMAPASEKLTEFLKRFAEFLWLFSVHASGESGSGCGRPPSVCLDSPISGRQRQSSPPLHSCLVREKWY